MTFRCIGICERYRFRKHAKYNNGGRYCPICHIFILFSNIRCPCCHSLMRAKKRHHKHDDVIIINNYKNHALSLD